MEKSEGKNGGAMSGCLWLCCFWGIIQFKEKGDGYVFYTGKSMDEGLNEKD